VGKGGALRKSGEGEEHKRSESTGGGAPCEKQMGTAKNAAFKKRPKNLIAMKDLKEGGKRQKKKGQYDLQVRKTKRAGLWHVARQLGKSARERRVPVRLKWTAEGAM